MFDVLQAYVDAYYQSESDMCDLNLQHTAKEYVLHPGNTKRWPNVGIMSKTPDKVIVLVDDSRTTIPAGTTPKCY